MCLDKLEYYNFNEITLNVFFNHRFNQTLLERVCNPLPVNYLHSECLFKMRHPLSNRRCVAVLSLLLELLAVLPRHLHV